MPVQKRSEIYMKYDDEVCKQIKLLAYDSHIVSIGRQFCTSPLL